MEITDVRVSLRESAPDSGAREGHSVERRLKGYATVTFERCFVVRNMKIIDGKNGLFVAMPSTKPKVACTRCHFKNDLGGRFCVQCGGGISRPPESLPAPGTPEALEALAHRDIAHPITVEFRQYLQQRVLEVYETERAREHRPPVSGAGAVDAGEAGA